MCLDFFFLTACDLHIRDLHSCCTQSLLPQLLLDDKLGQTKFDGGYVHNGLLKGAQWVFDTECDVLKELVEKYEDYTLTCAGHSLGAGVVTLLTMLVVKNRDKIGNIDRKRIRCFAIAPARCVSLNLAVRYADVINSVCDYYDL
ncbi:hypothetical protein LXL04_013948 [Taraxacum kok-saghyz]